ncbi:MAG: acyltransferase [Ahrensia sp.]|nr:acyltransferase [Ahrensia sp.]
MQDFPYNPEAEKNISYPWFDWLRFGLASVVVLGHAGFQFAPFLTGELAVDVFFALSGWLIGGILLRTEFSELPRFFFNRATRIWIPYGLALILLYGIAALREGINFFWVKYLVMDATFTHQLFTFFPVAKFEMPLDGSGNQFWSLAVEEQFYLLAPLVMLFSPWGKTLAVWLPISAVMVLIESHAGPITLGVLAAILQRDYGIVGRNWVPVLALVLAMASALALSLDRANSQWLSGPVFAVTVVVFLALPGRRSKIAQFFGGLSFPLYLNHWLGLAFVTGTAKHLGLLELPGLSFIAYFTAVFFTIPLYWLVDHQVMQRRNEWYTRTLGWRLGQVAYILVITGIIIGYALYQFGPHGVVPEEFQAISQ